MGEYNHSNPTNRIRARRLLEQMMPRALEQASAKKGFEPGDASDLFKALRPYIRTEILEGVHVYRTRLGGWHADVVLKDVLPLGLPRILGTATALPCATRSEAEQSAVAILAVLIGLARENERKGEPQKPGDAVFMLDDLSLRIPIAMLEELVATIGMPDTEYVLKRLSEIRQELTDRPKLDEAAVRRLDPEQMASLHAVAAMALLAGIPRWPQPEDAPPPLRTKH